MSDRTPPAPPPALPPALPPAPPARRHGAGFWVGVAAAVLVGLPLLAVAGVLAALNTGAGQREAEALVARLTGGHVRLAGLHGRVPDRLRLDGLELADTKGVWLSARSIVLDWSPGALLAGRAQVDALTVARLEVMRLPVPAPQTKPQPAASGPLRLPVGVRVRQLSIGALALDGPVAGVAATLAVSGQADLDRALLGSATLDATRSDAPGGRYTVTAQLSDSAIKAAVQAHEPARGLVSMAAHLPDLGALAVDLRLDGPRDAAVLAATVKAGQLDGSANGTIDLVGQAAKVALKVAAPAMQPAPGMGWQSVALDATLSGKWARPEAKGTLDIEGIAAGGAKIGRLAGTLDADTRQAALAVQAEGIVLAPPNEGLLAGGPLKLQAHVQLDDPARPVTYAFQHPLINGSGAAVLAPLLRAQLHVAVPDLGVLARAGGRDVAGSAAMDLQVSRTARLATNIGLEASMDVTGGADAPPAARGRTSLGATVTLDGADIVLSRLALDGRDVQASASGSRRDGRIAAQWHVAARDLAQLAPQLRGNAVLDGSLAGTMDGATTDFAADATLDGQIGTAAIAPGAVAFTLHGSGLPGRPAGQIKGQAMLAGAPLVLDVDASRDAAQALEVAINAARWKSADVAGALHLAAGATLPQGELRFAMTQLADLRPLIGQAVTGAVSGTLALPADGPARFAVQARDAGIAGQARVGSLTLDGTVTDPAGRRELQARLVADGVQAGAIGGRVSLTARGVPNALALGLDSALRGVAGADAAVTGAAVLNAGAGTVSLSRLAADWHGEHLALAGPAVLHYAPGIAVEHLALVASAGQGGTPARLEVAGSIRPALALNVTARNITPALTRPFAPSLDAAGTIGLTARLAGTMAAPTGVVRLIADGVRMRSGPAAALPAAGLVATATLAGRSATLDARLRAGSDTQLSVTGGVPLAANGALSLRAAGTASLALLDPILTPEGRRVRGTLGVDARIGGTAQAPAATGSLSLTGGEVQDYAQGIHITEIGARIEAEGQSLRITRFDGRAGGGTIGVSGTVGLGGEMPVALRIVARDARPITSDLVTTTLDAAIDVNGTATSSLLAQGSVKIRRADIQVPDRLPVSVAVLDVRRPGDKPPPAVTAPPLSVRLDVAVDAPGQIFVRGRGLDAELGGRLHVGGTAAAPQTSGAIGLRHGTFSLAGTTLDFTSGQISFNGATKIDPALDLVATSGTSDMVATLTVGGYASAPKITLSSVPDRPQDEVLAALLFKQSAASLSPFQLAQIAAALAQISGVGGGGPDPLSRLRKGLGLDRLSVGNSGPNSAGGASTGTSVEAGRYVAPGVYVGAKQGTSGSQTEAEVQIDITRGLKLQTDVGSGQGSNNVGLTYQFQY